MHFQERDTFRLAVFVCLCTYFFYFGGVCRASPSNPVPPSISGYQEQEEGIKIRRSGFMQSAGDRRMMCLRRRLHNWDALVHIQMNVGGSGAFRE